MEDALHLANINYVKRLPGFKEGEFFIQDESSMLLYQLSGVDEKKKETDELHILDLCAAPGGKCTHFAQKLGDRAFIKARDLTENKISLITVCYQQLVLQRKM